MQINPVSYNNLSFKKTLVAKCNVVRGHDEFMPSKIYEIDAEEDKDYFYKVKTNPNWKDSEYLHIIDGNLDHYRRTPEDGKGFSFYSMEDKFGECIGACYIFSTKDTDSLSVEVIETAPKFQNRDRNSKLKYIGETFLSFFTKLAKKNNKESIFLVPVPEARDFYLKKCFFEKVDDAPYIQLYEDSYDKLIKQNEKHCGGEITMV